MIKVGMIAVMGGGGCGGAEGGWTALHALLHVSILIGGQPQCPFLGRHSVLLEDY